MVIEKKSLQVGALELQLELADGALRAVDLPETVPDDFGAQALRQVVRKLSDYEIAFDEATPFTHAVWTRMREIPAGETVSYGALAAAMGRPKAARAVGAAVGRNRLLILLPCHRIVGKSGLGGFRGGLAWKRKLLDLERA